MFFDNAPYSSLPSKEVTYCKYIKNCRKSYYFWAIHTALSVFRSIFLKKANYDMFHVLMSDFLKESIYLLF
jgi:hypothetical protein